MNIDSVNVSKNIYAEAAATDSGSSVILENVCAPPFKFSGCLWVAVNHTEGAIYNDGVHRVHCREVVEADEYQRLYGIPFKPVSLPANGWEGRQVTDTGPARREWVFIPNMITLAYNTRQAEVRAEVKPVSRQPSCDVLQEAKQLVLF